MPTTLSSKPFTPVLGKLSAACSCASFVAQQKTNRAVKQRKITGTFGHQQRALKAAAAAVEADYLTQTQLPAAVSEPSSYTRPQDDTPPEEADTAHFGTHMTSLNIRNFALIEEEHVQFKPGLNVITGGSGAGKSVLIEAFGQVLGLAATDHCVRPPATTATIEASIYLSSTAQAAVSKLLQSLGIPRAISPASQQLMLRRELTNHDESVRSRCFVNGIATSLRVLREIGQALVDVNGQHAAVSIRDDATQLALLDRVAGTEAAAASFGSALQQLRDTEEQLADIASLGSEEEREELQHTIQEVHKARLEEGEERKLRAELRQLDARRSSVERAGLFHQALSGDGGSSGFLEELQALEGHVTFMLDTEEAFAEKSTSGGAAQDQEAGAADADVAESIEVLDGAVCRLMEARSLLRKAESQVAAYARKYRYLQQDYDEAASRLHTVERLLKQYQCSTSEELLTEVDQAQADLDRWYALEGREEELKVQRATQLRQLQEAAGQLSMRRREGGKKLKAAVESCLGSLAMAASHFAVELAWRPTQQENGLLMPEELSRQADQEGGVTYSVHSCGLDHVTFMLAPGPQEPLRPLAGVASGGESARIMLAMKAAPLAIAVTGVGSEEEGSMPPPLMVLDELDTGVGARLGKAVGSLLRGLSAQPSVRNSPGQILCVSHLPQVAAYADHHLCVRKAVDAEGRVRTAVDALLDTSDRAHEVAAMLGLDYNQAMQMLEEVKAETAVSSMPQQASSSR